MGLDKDAKRRWLLVEVIVAVAVLLLWRKMMMITTSLGYTVCSVDLMNSHYDF